MKNSKKDDISNNEDIPNIKTEESEEQNNNKENKNEIKENKNNDETNKNEKDNKKLKKEKAKKANKNEKTKKSNNDEINNEEPKKQMGFFNKVWWSITKIEKYPELASEGLWRAISYLFVLSVILSLVTSCRTISITKKEVKTGIESLSFDFTYKDGILNVESDDQPITVENEELGRIIIDTKTEDENKINEYKNSIENKQEAIVVLKDKVLIANLSYESGNIQNPTINVIEKKYTDLKDQYKLDINEFTKQELLDYLSSSKMNEVYWNYFLAMFAAGWLFIIVNLLAYVILISFFGYATVWMLKLKVKYSAVFSMTIYAITLSVIIDIFYQLLNIFVDFKIEIDTLTVLLTAIYLFAAIFMIKDDFNKKQGQLQKIKDEEKETKNEYKEKLAENPDKRENKENKESKKDEKEKNDNEDNNESKNKEDHPVEGSEA